MRLGRALRPVAGVLLVLGLCASISPVYRDFFADRRDRYRGTSAADYMGHLEQDRRVLRSPSLGAWLWNPDKAFGVPRLLELNNRPLYPVHLAFAAVLPAPRAWHWIQVFHVCLKALGLVLLTLSLGWPFWIAVTGSTGAMLAEGSLRHFSDFAFTPSAAWFLVQAWLTVRAARHDRWTAWDSLWVACAALRVLGSNATFVVYYELLLLFLLVRLTWGRLRVQAGKLMARYALAGLLLAPLLLPVALSYGETLRAHFAEFADWHLRRAYNFRNYWVRFSDLQGSILLPAGAWLAAVAAVALQGGRVGPLTQVLGAFFVFGLAYSIRYSPVWFLGGLVPGIRVPQWVFEPLPWLIVLVAGEAAARHGTGRRRLVLAVVLGGAVMSAAWQTQHDPTKGYIFPPWERLLPEGLAARVRAEAPAPAVFPTGPDRSGDSREPVLNSNHHFMLGLAGAHYLGEMPSYHYARATYRVPGLLFMQRVAMPLVDWDEVVDIYAELGVGWVFWDGAGEPVSPRLEPAGEEHGFRLYRITGARPRVYALDRVRSVPAPASPAEVASLVFSLPALGPFCYGCPESAAASPAAEVRLAERWRPGDVTVDVESPRGTLVVLGETRSRGWRTTVDGAPADILPVNELFQGVAVPEGRHRVEWRFVSPGFFAGLGLAAAGVVLLVAAVALGARRSGRTHG